MKSSISLSDQPVILEKPAFWSHIFLWVIMLVSTSAIVWAYFARLEQTVPAVGELEFSDGAREIQAPTTGAVVRLHVENGDRVVKNQPLLTFSPTNPSADLRSLEQVRETLQRENQFYEDVVRGQATGQLSAELDTLIKERSARIAENQALQSLIDELYNGRFGSGNYSPALSGLVSNYRAEYLSRINTVQLQIQELEKQLQQAQDAEAAAREQLGVAQSQLQFAQNQLAYSQEQLNSSREQLELARGQLAKSEQVLASNRAILDRLVPLVEEGGIAVLQKDRQEQEVLRGENEVLRQQDQIEARLGEINQRQGEINTRRGEVNTREGAILDIQAEIEQQISEQQRLQVAIARTAEQLQNTKDAWARELYTRIEENNKAIASTDSQLGRYKLENTKRLSEINAQLEKVEQERNTQVLRAPSGGIVYELAPSTKDESELDVNQDEICQYISTTVLNPEDPRLKRCEEAYYEAQQTETLLQILDDDGGLEAVVYVQNTDVALVLNALRNKREKLAPYNNQEIAGEVIECTPEKDCLCPASEEARQQVGLDERDCIPVEVNIDAFPAGEFGTVPGELKWISQEAIPPDELRQYFSFKAKIQLEREHFVLNEDEDLKVDLQAGMAVNSKINIGKRTVLQMLFSRLTGQFNSITNVR
ncbi:chromosome partitioning protein ParA [Capilliphycus salinus ALCB114379]|uniref:chromosome partitioning protein ParA n=1 Tax=Capilliphycus salinus TaxID=2768948 RepID=UPI0039A73137